MFELGCLLAQKLTFIHGRRRTLLAINPKTKTLFKELGQRRQHTPSRRRRLHVYVAIVDRGRREKNRQKPVFLFSQTICTFAAGFFVTTRQWPVLEGRECDF